MGFLFLRLYRFRNLRDETIDLDAPEIFLLGQNGQGKTNLLEAIYLLCFGSSFRTRIDAQLCRDGSQEMSVFGRYRLPSEDENTLQVRIQNKSKQILFNDKPVADRKELIQNIPCIVFSHGDIAFVSGSPDMQRHFFNQTLSLQHPYFVDLLRRYRKILRQRNVLLKDRRTDLLEVYDQQWVQVGCDIQRLRAQTVKAFNATFSRIHRHVSGIPEELCIQYRPSWREWSEPDEAFGLVRERRPHDVGYGTSTSGPHRDRFVFRLGGRDFTEVASTGQLRLVSLILRVAQAVYFAEGTGKRPVLLIDDVLLELDAEKRQRFLEALPDYEQAFFTFLPDEPYRRYLRDSTRVYFVENGEFSEHGTSRGSAPSTV